VKKVAISISKGNPQQPSSALSVLKSQASEVMQSVRGGSLDQTEWPMSASEAIRQFTLTEFENQEIQNYDNVIYYTGAKCKSKVKGHPIKMVPSDGSVGSSIVGSRRLSTQRNKAVKMIPSQR